jgi:hypothetical protein
VHLCFVGMPAPGSSGLEAIPNADFWRAFFGNVAHGGSVVYVLGALLALAMLDLLMGPSNWGVVYRVSGVCVCGGGVMRHGVLCAYDMLGRCLGGCVLGVGDKQRHKEAAPQNYCRGLGVSRGRGVSNSSTFFSGEPERSPPCAMWR